MNNDDLFEYAMNISNNKNFKNQEEKNENLFIYNSFKREIENLNINIINSNDNNDEKSYNINKLININDLKINENNMNTINIANINFNDQINNNMKETKKKDININQSLHNAIKRITYECYSNNEEKEKTLNNNTNINDKYINKNIDRLINNEENYVAITSLTNSNRNNDNKYYSENIYMNKVLNLGNCISNSNGKKIKNLNSSMNNNLVFTNIEYNNNLINNNYTTKKDFKNRDNNFSNENTKRKKIKTNCNTSSHVFFHDINKDSQNIINENIIDNINLILPNNNEKQDNFEYMYNESNIKSFNSKKENTRITNNVCINMSNQVFENKNNRIKTIYNMDKISYSLKLDNKKTGNY
ncbi:hypothetical protein BCR36DRAFT_459397 [Piromyces finnis]|uniref:Uncharacterized protein n=1 Tax=Piromyces finnis TaxID=1754191 RepID=A0A1Y1VIY9_9FUNG|nr:hypothetical protein BCR36DRAFT_459397 [Piromyces finnis]|eukprot:ORX57683.1 hypothetical protein BCR36DRAFT_459397 [Piromyces finnis]